MDQESNNSWSTAFETPEGTMLPHQVEAQRKGREWQAQHEASVTPMTDAQLDARRKLAEKFANKKR